MSACTSVYVCVSACVCARARARALTDHLHGGLPSAGTYTLLTDSCGCLSLVQGTV